MVWCPSVRGILVTEGVCGEGGVLRKSEGKRFMFDNVPEMFKGDHAFFLQAEDGIRSLVRSRGLGDVYRSQKQRKFQRLV